VSRSRKLERARSCEIRTWASSEVPRPSELRFLR
jgi:hypothetical protein